MKAHLRSLSDFTVKRKIRQIRLAEGRVICEEKMRGFFYSIQEADNE